MAVTPAQAAGIAGAQALWKLQYAERGKASITEVAPKDLAGFAEAPWFVTSDDATGVTMTAPVDGPTTSGSHYTRCEGREMTLDGKPAAWDSRKGAHRLMLWLRLDSLMIGGKVSLIQLHDDLDDQIQILAERTTSGYRLYWSVGKGKGKGGDLATIDSEFQAGVWVPAMLEVVPGRTNFYYGPDWSTPRVSTKTMRQSAKSYAKWGPYCQVSGPKGANITASFRAVTITHDATVTPTPAGPTGSAPAPVPPPTAQNLGVGGIATPAGAILATADSTSTLSITTSGKVYDGQGHTVKQIKIAADNVTVQNYRVAGAGNAGVYTVGTGNTIRNCDISGVNEGGVGDINALSFFGDGTQILFNNIHDLAQGDPKGSHTDGAQTWNTPSKRSSSNVVIRGNRFDGPPRSDPGYLHQGVMAEGARSTDGGGGGTGVSRNWLVEGNYFRTYGNQALKFDDIHDVVIARNVFAGAATKVVEVGDLSTGVTFLDDNQVGAGYGSVGVPVTAVPQPGPLPGAPVILVIRHAEKPADPNDHTLSPTGRRRAAALAKLFTRDPLPAGLSRPTALYASQGKTASRRPAQTIAPLAVKLALPIVTTYDAAHWAAAAKELATQPGVTLACWAQQELPRLCAALGAKVPPDWPDDRFDVVWCFTRQPDGSWRFTQIPQLIMPGDRPDIIR